jgi:hypothetical protein
VPLPAAAGGWARLAEDSAGFPRGAWRDPPQRLGGTAASCPRGAWRVGVDAHSGRACCPLGAAAGVQGLICVCSWAGESCCRLSGWNPPTCRGGGVLPLGPPPTHLGGARVPCGCGLAPPGGGAGSTLLGWLILFAGGSVGHPHQAELGCYTGIDEQ